MPPYMRRSAALHEPQLVHAASRSMRAGIGAWRRAAARGGALLEGLAQRGHALVEGLRRVVPVLRRREHLDRRRVTE